jgi:putative transposase
MTRRKRHTPEEIVRKLQKADRLAAGGANADEIARDLQISTATLYNWRSRYGAMNVDEAKELRRLRDENDKLKRLVADKELENLALKEIASGNF